MKLKVTVSPNPFIKQLTVFIDGHFALNIVVRLLNSEGAMVRITSCTLHKGENKIEIKNAGRLAKGNYLLEIKLLNGDLLETTQVIKS